MHKYFCFVSTFIWIENWNGHSGSSKIVPVFSPDVPCGSGAFLLDNCPASVCPVKIEGGGGGGGNPRNEAVTCYLTPKARDGRYCNAPPPPVCPSVTFSFRTVTRKRIDVQVHAPCHVCCIVFYIDGMLFEFLMNFLNIEKNNNISCFLRVLCYFQHRQTFFF